MNTYTPAGAVPPQAPPVVQQPVAIDPGHRHDTAKGAASGAAAAVVIPGIAFLIFICSIFTMQLCLGIGPVVGGIVGAGIGHHEKKKHQAQNIAGMQSY